MSKKNSAADAAADDEREVADAKAAALRAEKAAGWNAVCDGDAIGGWIVEVKDGERSDTYSPEAATAEEAIEAAKAAHADRWHA
jgi:hypothetical protein